MHFIWTKCRMLNSLRQIFPLSNQMMSSCSCFSPKLTEETKPSASSSATLLRNSRRPLTTIAAVVTVRRPVSSTIVGSGLNLERTFVSRRSFSSPTLPQHETESTVKRSVFNVMQRYEDIIGLTAVKEAQDKVLQTETDFSKCQEARREKQQEIKRVQLRLKEIHSELDKTSRGEDRYLSLLTQEHAVIKEERLLLDEFQVLEKREREHFTRLSHCLRESHEKERERGERTKYWSIIGSAIGALIGILGTTLNNRLRMRELRNLVTESADPGRVTKILNDLSDMVQTQQHQVRAFVTDLRGMLTKQDVGDKLPAAHLITQPQTVDPEQWLSAHSDKILLAIREQDNKLDSEMTEIKKMIAVERGYSLNQDGTIVYVGPEMESLLDQTEKNLEWKMKIQTVVNVVLIYGALAIALPLIAAIFKDG